MKVHLQTIGCRLNQAEIETMARQLQAGGHVIVDDAAQADTIILNTCAVTAEAARDARRLTRRFHHANETAEIILTGCYATLAPETVAALPGVGRVVGNNDKERLPLLLDAALPADQPDFDREPLARQAQPGGFGRTRGFVKVQDGCDNRCTFCVTTVARGAGRSRHLGDVVAEVQRFAAAGYGEVVLTGVHLGSYGRDLGRPAGLRELVAALLAHTDVARIRLSSLEPWEISDGFFRLWENPRLMPHLHLPLQSGSDPVLRRMARRTSRAAFRALVHEARAHIADLSLSTDLICGFPGETDDNHAQTLTYVEEIGFSRLHVFSYSPRPGTAAARMTGQIPGPLKRERTTELIALGDEMSVAFHRRYEGATRPVLWETATGAEAHGLRWSGYTDNYIRVTATGPADLMRRVTPVRLSGARVEGMSGALVG
ncbi:MAG: tRNA (N(6)-L-threonylcarbamoyladenosine(37)-C(2))-methylthiotransferase MtaB [Anaerolineae bacterium]|uniref:tRNA (N(6)-L-threonylcarbamoyladenosine(37)-C(2))- methylthiotransferase MtaB n=1 Tax=Promineifilum sp. TaxID=2664178 RepID=UPI001D3F3546|nr:tRNA (N(6)-L-threonylcarbamoyladenosine(37)-C(2))-methylthiotransferase MtaB [Anaerolineales bacterium]MCO5181326.1 tRNA (N(6)-L-threonylcarbamoyladenosine(37)-C(2))-methylthiotransferase MtaB [Promineifilum sp.]MCW5847305.1 tRNA (N(6)-L-threonylcarbamoyladenosine(37)-C(2))-methylthiotransferase MtaB [Anaerolineae bacterium]